MYYLFHLESVVLNIYKRDVYFKEIVLEIYQKGENIHLTFLKKCLNRNSENFICLKYFMLFKCLNNMGTSEESVLRYKYNKLLSFILTKELRKCRFKHFQVNNIYFKLLWEKNFFSC